MCSVWPRTCIAEWHEGTSEVEACSVGSPDGLDCAVCETGFEGKKGSRRHIEADHEKAAFHSKKCGSKFWNGVNLGDWELESQLFWREISLVILQPVDILKEELDS